MTKTGTREWAEKNLNIQRGCEHGCRYCYACSNAMRYKQVESYDEWLKPVLNEKSLKKKPYKVNGRIMFPTTHDITPENVDQAIPFLRSWLELGNEILIVSKPHLDVIKEICIWLVAYKDQIMFRFTISSMDDGALEFWEPGAPGYEERKAALKYCFDHGYKTSVSMEPYLDVLAIRTFMDLVPYITDTIWIGKMNRIRDRIDKTGWTQDDYKFLTRVIESQTDEKIRQLYDTLKDKPQVRWKDSIKRVIGLPAQEGVE